MSGYSQVSKQVWRCVCGWFNIGHGLSCTACAERRKLDMTTGELVGYLWGRMQPGGRG